MTRDPTHLSRLATIDLEARTGMLLIPVGATEGHGPHLPLATDTLIAQAWAEALARALPDALVADPLAFSSSGEHQSFAGTLSIGQEALTAVLVELVRSAKGSFDSVVLVSGHGGNSGVLSGVVRTMRDEGHRISSLVPIISGSDAHAGHTETSIMLHLHPELVRMDRSGPGCQLPLSEIMTELEIGGVASVSPNGVLGDPTGATAEAGKRLFDELVANGLEKARKALRASDP